jgi:hypothetical protein
MWLAPAVMFIESAADSLTKADPNMLTAELKEMASFGNARIQRTLDALWPLVGDGESNAFSGLDHDTAVIFAKGYLLGLQTARTVLMGSTQLAINNIKPDSLL